ncbi:hypothetical protein B0H63DRAFT_507121 [Podospora didyma]|uniref:Uncharacterized protein n=1 Tax=Podospora didyma TaxID=330526 RepID=A0AAE0U3J1_9PEZI|nr:hypothetical protein B0H63DRAFT_507121 [Podospora didyma]
MATTFLILSDTHDDTFPDATIFFVSNSVSPDPKWWQENLIEGEDDPDEPAQALALFAAAEKANGLPILGEGTHKFILREGRTFTTYTSPYTPEFNGYAFAYGPDENRFGALGAEHPIPSECGVDIVITHGLPALLTPESSQASRPGPNSTVSATSMKAMGSRRYFGSLKAA